MTETAPRRRWQTWALVASVALNLAFAGLIGGAIVKGPPPGPFPGLWQYGRALPEPYRGDLGRALRDSRKEWIGAREALGGQRAALAAALTADPFDPAAVAALLQGAGRVTEALSARASTLLMQQIDRMTPEDRAAYAAALRAARDDRGPPGPRDHPGPKP